MPRRQHTCPGIHVPARNNAWQVRTPYGRGNLSDAALAFAREIPLEECFIAGGEAIYRDGLKVADRVYLTRVDAEPEGDTFFPKIDETLFECIERESHVADERHDHAFTIEIWQRRAQS